MFVRSNPDMSTLATDRAYRPPCARCRSQVALYQRALTYEAEGADSVSVNTMVKATYDMHDVVCFASAS